MQPHRTTVYMSAWQHLNVKQTISSLYLISLLPLFKPISGFQKCLCFIQLKTIPSAWWIGPCLSTGTAHGTWWRHQMETFSALLAICAGGFPAQRPVTQSFDVFFHLRLNKRLRKQSWGWWFETLSRPLWRHCNGKVGFSELWHSAEYKKSVTHILLLYHIHNCCILRILISLYITHILMPNNIINAFSI